MTPHPSNFSPLAEAEPQLSRLGMLAERFLSQDPSTALVKLRQFGELLTRAVASRAGLAPAPEEPQYDLLRRLRREELLPEQVFTLLDGLRRSGNRAAHEGVVDEAEALEQLKFAWILGVWYLHTFLDPGHRCGEFLVPPRLDAQAQELTRLRAQLEETEAARSEAERHLAALRAQPTNRPALVAAANKAAASLPLNEAQTRTLIDAQLRAAGWEADSQRLRYSQGTRPEAGRNIAIAEWPTPSGPADYLLFLGLTPVAVVEAKRKNTNAMGALEQAARYSRDFQLERVPGLVYPQGPWGEYRVPLLYATNGRPYLRQLRVESGIWFRDARRSVNPSVPLTGWHTPQGLTALLEQDHAAAEAQLDAEALQYSVGLRDYQQRAIRAVEGGIAAGRRELLLAMATGTGKTKTAIALIYRLLKARRFRRVLFLVDREALGEQAGNDFRTTRLEGTRTFADTFGLKALDDGPPEADTAVHVTTVQGLVRRILSPDEDGPPPVDSYDLIVVDEAHRGYTLDRDLGESELGWRDEADFVSKYRRVLDHFDAVKVALTATPALHTSEIFGPPVFTYTYREAVLDGVLVDHEPPQLIRTRLSEEGIHWRRGERIETYTPGDDETGLYEAPDDIGLEVESFNRRVIAPHFTRVVCEVLARELNPHGPEKTLVFCVNDRHAYDVVEALNTAFREVYGELDDGAVVKITGASDRPLELVRRYRNEQLPAVAVTVDLLTTGVDVPAISTLVFLRQVRSRILFEQMLGRATRRCDEIGKTVFRIYDAVHAYAAMAGHTVMNPVVQNPQRSLSKLLQDLQAAPSEAAQRLVRDQLAAKLQRLRLRLTDEARASFQNATGHTPERFIAALRAQPPGQLVPWLAPHAPALRMLDSGRTPGGQPIFISDHADEVTEMVQAYPTGERAEDYLQTFARFVAEGRDRIPALLTVLTRPAELTRAELRELALILDGEGYSAAHLQRAFAQVRQVDTAAGLIGFIRAAAENETPQDFGARVDAALARLLGSRNWTQVQRRWLQNMAAQIKANTVLDRAAMDEPGSVFRQQVGGFERLDKLFDGQLDRVLRDLQTQIWA